jgi:hypothetical protein
MILSSHQSISYLLPRVRLYLWSIANRIYIDFLHKPFFDVISSDATKNWINKTIWHIKSIFETPYLSFVSLSQA